MKKFCLTVLMIGFSLMAFSQTRLFVSLDYGTTSFSNPDIKISSPGFKLGVEKKTNISNALVLAFLYNSVNGKVENDFSNYQQKDNSIGLLIASRSYLTKNFSMQIGADLLYVTSSEITVDGQTQNNPEVQFREFNPNANLYLSRQIFKVVEIGIGIKVYPFGILTTHGLHGENVYEFNEDAIDFQPHFNIAWDFYQFKKKKI